MKRKYIFKDLVGTKFNRWLITEFAGVIDYQFYWKCICECGIIKDIQAWGLFNGKSQSCGCYRNQKSIERFKTHGMSYTNFYAIWEGLKERCLNFKSKSYRLYGGQGIKLCKRWFKFENFRDDMYESYLKHLKEFGRVNTQLDRINNKGNYIKENCKWSTKREQSRNRKIAAKTNNYDEHMLVRHRLSSYLRRAILRNYNTTLFFKRFGCTPNEFRKRIESQFLPGMTWENHGQGLGFWELDHIKECHDFDLSKEKDILECFNYTNFQPLWWPENLKKTFSIYPQIQDIKQEGGNI